MPQLYDELRLLAHARMKNERAGQTISGTVLVHEAYMRLKKEGGGSRWVNKKQFFSAASEAMRRILVDRFRAKMTVKRGMDYERVDLPAEIAAPVVDEKVLAIDSALEELAAVDPELADLVKLRFFVGFTLEEIAEAQETSVGTVTRQWAFARSWLADRLSSDL